MGKQLSMEYKKVSKPLIKWIDKNLQGWKIAGKPSMARGEHGSDIECIRTSRRGTKRRVLIEVKYGKGKKGENRFHSHFIDSLGELLFHMGKSKHYQEYGVAWHINDKKQFIEKINKMKPSWKKLRKELNCRWVFFAGKKCEKHSWCDLLKTSRGRSK